MYSGVKEIQKSFVCDDSERITGGYHDFTRKIRTVFEYDIEDYGIIADCITNKVQTCVYYGVEKNEIQRMVQDNCLMGIDRIVPVGSSLDIGVIWDGYDIVGQLSRIIG